MITRKSTYEDVAAEYLADFPTLAAKKKTFQAKFGTLVKRSRSARFPMTAQYEYICPSSGNRYLYCYTAFKRSDWAEPYCNAVCLFEGKRGLHAAVSTNNRQAVIIFTPHFFERYRERILKDGDIVGDALIKRYLSRNTRYVLKEIDETFAKAYRKYEDDESQTYAAEVNEGNIFLKSYGGRILVCRTIISDEMLREGQPEAFGQLKTELRRLGHIKIQGYKDHYSRK